MNILLESRAFHPSGGGLETVSRQLADAWQAAGHRVRVMTVTSLQDAEELDTLSVIRHPAPRRQLQLARWSDIFVQSGISLRSLWLPFVARRPLVMIHHNMIFNNQGSRALSALKWAAARLGQNIAVSRAVGRNLPPSTAVIPNPFRSSLPEISNAAERSGLLFVGRLVSAKGGDVALDALARLHAQEGGDAPPLLTICGDGPDRAALERQARALGLQEAVTFAGWTAPRELAAHYARAEALLVPSRYEPFGIVALEALSCGCPVVAARTGGLPEAVGPCGLLFESENADDLARRIRRVRRPEEREQLMEQAPEHLARHDVDRIAKRYLGVLEKAVAEA